jgi:Serine carboxypeptidase S28
MGAIECWTVMMGLKITYIGKGVFLVCPVSDMFWDAPWSWEGFVWGCQQQWGVTPRKLWANTQWGGRRLQYASNIVFSNGLLDPWHGGGVLTNLSESLQTIIIPEVCMTDSPRSSDERSD